QGSASFAELEAAHLARERAHARDVAALVAREVAARLEAAHESGGIAGTGRVEGLAVAGVEQREVVERALLGAGIGAKPILDDAFARAESFARALDDGHPARAAALDAPEVVVEHRLAAAGLVGPLGREDRDRLGTRRFPEAGAVRPIERGRCLLRGEPGAHGGDVHAVSARRLGTLGALELGDERARQRTDRGRHARSQGKKRAARRIQLSLSTSARNTVRSSRTCKSSRSRPRFPRSESAWLSVAPRRAGRRTRSACTQRRASKGICATSSVSRDALAHGSFSSARSV